MKRASQELTESVRSTLLAHADSIEIDLGPFDPGRPGTGPGLAADVPPDLRSRSPRPHLILAVAVLACLVAAGIAVLAVHRSDGGRRVDTSVGEPEPTPRSLTDVVPPFEIPESARPAIPDGWQVLDYDDFRFAVPAGWQVSGTPICWTGGLGTGPIDADGGLVIVRSSPGAPVPTCGPATHLPGAWLVIEGGHGAPPSGLPVRIGTLSAVADAEPGCLECRGQAGPVTTYHFDDGYTVSVGGPDADRILATFTDAGRVRVVQSGPMEDTTSWQTVSLDGVSFTVPADWPVVDLTTRTATTGGLDPGACGSSWFGGDDGPRVYTGSSGTLPSCPPTDRAWLDPTDGVWIRTLPGPYQDLLVSTVSGLELDGVSVNVGYPDPSIPAVDVIVTTSRSRIGISIGAGDTQAIARSILRSIAAG